MEVFNKQFKIKTSDDNVDCPVSVSQIIAECLLMHSAIGKHLQDTHNQSIDN